MGWGRGCVAQTALAGLVVVVAHALQTLCLHQPQIVAVTEP